MREMLQEEVTVKSKEPARPTIVCIDDDPEVSHAVRMILSKYDVDVISACNGEQGIWEAITHDPALIITDLKMPQGTGELVLECLKSLPKTRSVPIIVLTGLRNPRLELQMKRLGAAGYLVKPASAVQLLEEIQKHIALRESGERRQSLA